MSAFARLATEFLSVSAQAAHIAAAQEVPVHVLEIEGEERLIYGTTPTSEAALDVLTGAFMPAIEKAARASRVLDEGDALSVALLEFVEAVRDFDLEAPLPFSATIATRLRYAVLRADRANDLVRVKDNVAAVYWRLIHKHDGDFAAAYEEVKATDNGLAPATFMAVHNVIGGIDSLDPVLCTEDDDHGPRHALASAVGSHEDRLTDRDEVEWLFTLVSDRQEAILRLAYGFSDAATEEIRLAKGYAIGEIMTDAQTAHALDLTRPTAQRERTRALATMREALEARVEA